MNSESLREIGAAAGLSPGQTSRVIAVLEDYLAELEQGGQPHPEELLARHPDLAETLRPYLDKLDVLHRAAISLRNPAPLAETSAAGPVPEAGTLGDFHLAREVGRGGMGVVYEARQISLNRRVALKVLPFAVTLDAKALQRFRNEAQAAAQLHHPNIVPVYFVGCERGVHFYAMQFIDGRSLAEVIRQHRRLAGLEPAAETDSAFAADGNGLPVPEGGAATPPAAGMPTEPSFRSRAYFRTMAQLGVQAAEALEHAHQLGVVHRDVKPANLLVEWRAGGVSPPVLWVTDFGLALCHGEAGLTLTGDLVGTLRYMSPEQALARRGLVDQRADVYGLGVTLYELLTLQPAFDGRDRQELLRQVAFEEPPPPRRLNPAVPVELETVLLKAMAKEPAARYATAQELADDLRRFLEDKPVHARRPGLRERAAKWARRNRPLVAAAAVVAAVALVALAVSTVMVWREGQRTRAALEQAREKQRLAQQVVNDMYTDLATEWLEHEPQQERLQRDFLLRALAYYQRFAREDGADPEVRHETARAAWRVGDIQQKLGEYDAARQAYGEAMDLLGRLADDCPGVPDYGQDLARCTHSLGILLAATGRPREAEEAYRRAAARQERLAADFPAVPAYRHDLAVCHQNLAALLLEAGRYPEAEQSCARALSLCEGLAADDPECPACQDALASAHNNQGTLHWDNGRLADAEKSWRQALVVVGPLVDRLPKAPAYAETLADVTAHLGILLVSTGRAAEGEAHLRQALALRQQLAACFPRKLNHQRELALGYYNLALHWKIAGRYPQGEQAYRKAVEVQEKLVERFPAVTAYRRELARSLNNLANIQKDTGRPKEAEGGYERALGLVLGHGDDYGKAPLCKDELSIYQNNLGYLYWQTGRPEKAERLYREALTLRTGLVEDFAGVPAYRERLAEGYANLGHLLKGAGRAGAAEEAYRQALAQWQKLAAEPASPHRNKVAQLHNYLGQLLCRAGRAPAAAQEFERAAREWDGLLEGRPDHLEALNSLAWFLATCPEPRFRDPARAVALAEKAVARVPEAGALWNTLGAAHYRAGDYPAALAALEKSAQLRSGGEVSDFLFLAMTHARLGRKQQARQWYERAVQAARQGPLQEEALANFRDEAAALLERDDESK